VVDYAALPLLDGAPGWADFDGADIGGLSGRRRVIKNGATYAKPGGGRGWSQAGLRAGGVSTESGQFSHSSRRGPLWIDLRDANDVGRRAALRMSLAERPDCWVSWQPHLNASVDAVFDEDGRSATYPWLWDGVESWHVETWESGYEDTFTQRAADRPQWLAACGGARFPFLVKNAGHVSLTPNTDGGIDVYDTRDGAKLGAMQKPQGWDEAAIVGPVGNTIPNVPSSFVIAGEHQGATLVYVEVDDINSVVGDLVVDPITVITDSGDVDCSRMIAGGLANYNFGGLDNQDVWGGTGTSRRRALCRVATSALPDGTINSSILSLYWRPQGAYATGTTDAHRILPANYDWVQGTGTGSGPQAGSVCHNYKAYDASSPTSWAGGAGMISGTDFDATPEDSVFRVNPTDVNTYIDWTIATATIDLWKADATNNGGVVLKDSTESSSTNYFDFGSDLDVTNPAKWTIDYTTGPAGHAHYYNLTHLFGQ
jgi:hypothetical protein